MLSRFEYRLKTEKPLSIQMSSSFHGVLMELVNEDFGDKAHESALHPYSQHLEKRGDEWYWVINTLSEETEDAICNALQGKNAIHLLKHDMDLPIELCRRERCSDEDLKNLFYRVDHNGCFQIRFVTPAAFKRRGEYLIYPDLFCIYQSLMNRYDSVSDKGFFDEDTLQELVEHSRITRYQLRSTGFSVEGVRIPSFYGNITIRMNGTMTMKRFANMLFHFGEFSGVGIKTALGMGVIALGSENRQTYTKEGGGEQNE